MPVSRWQLSTDSKCTVLRLYPSVPVNSRLAVRTTTLPAGGGPDGKMPVLVRKGEAVGFCSYAMHRREDIFGPDAAVFRPERWLERDGELAISAGFGYLPFNAGPRLCLGREYLSYLCEALHD
jgi:cytochrome P450